MIYIAFHVIAWTGFIIVFGGLILEQFGQEEQNE